MWLMGSMQSPRIHKDMFLDSSPPPKLIRKTMIVKGTRGLGSWGGCRCGPPQSREECVQHACADHPSLF